MIKKTIIDDPTIYLRLKESGLRADYYFNRKDCSNDKRGHFATEQGMVVCDRSAPALSVFMSGSSTFLNMSGSVVFQLV